MPDIFQARPSSEVKQVVSVARDYSTVEEFGQKQSRPWSTFVVHPQRIKFETQDKEEEVLLLLRRHMITNVPWMVAAILASLGPLVAQVVPGFGVLPPAFKMVGVMAWFLLVLGYI